MLTGKTRLMIILLKHRNYKLRTKDLPIHFPGFCGRINKKMLLLLTTGILITILFDILSLNHTIFNMKIHRINIVFASNPVEKDFQNHGNREVDLYKIKGDFIAYYRNRKIRFDKLTNTFLGYIFNNTRADNKIYSGKYVKFIRALVYLVYHQDYYGKKADYWKATAYTAPINEEFMFRFFLYSALTLLFINFPKSAKKNKKKNIVVVNGCHT